MAEDATESAPLCKTALSKPFFKQFTRKTEFLSYLVLCVVKMPFIPPVSITRPRSVCVPGLTVKERVVSASSLAPFNKTKGPIEDHANSVKDRLASNIKQLERKSQPRSRLPTGRGAAGLRVEGRNPWLPSQRLPLTLPGGSCGSSSFPASSSGESMTQSTQQSRSRDSPQSSTVKSDPEPEERKEACFTLTLTPDAVLLLQRRSAEKQRLPKTGTNTGELADPRRRRENNLSKRPPGHRGNSVPSTRAVHNNNAVTPGDISSLVKISLLNERYKYDDVEYEEDGPPDEHVVLKCTAWLRGLESTPVTVGKSTSQKGF